MEDLKNPQPQDKKQPEFQPQGPHFDISGKDGLYPGQDSTELTQRVIFKHVIFILPFIVALVILAILAIPVLIYISANIDSVIQVVPVPAVLLVASFYITILVLLLISVLWIWRRNKVVITDQHIVDIDQLGLFTRVVSTLRLEEIQDISASVKGPLQTILQYGSIVIQTAGERENFVFNYVPKPYELEHYILSIRKKYNLPGDDGVKSL
jgi:membrane protein YdbS with pleckstrin-like domain